MKTFKKIQCLTHSEEPHRSSADPITFCLFQLVQATWQGSAQPLNIQIVIDVSTDLAQPGAKLGRCLLPSTSRACVVFAMSYPRHCGFMEHQFLQPARLHGSVFSIESLQAMFLQSGFELLGDLPPIVVEESLAPVDEENSWLAGALESQIHC